MLECYYLYVVAYRKFTTSDVILGIFPNSKEAFNFLNAFHSKANIFQVTKDELVFDDFGVRFKNDCVKKYY